MKLEFLLPLFQTLSLPYPDKRKKKEKPAYRVAKYSLEYVEWVMMKCVEMGGHFSTHIDMCSSDTTLSEEDPYMHKVMEVVYLYEYDGHIKPMFNVIFLF